MNFFGKPLLDLAWRPANVAQPALAVNAALRHAGHRSQLTTAAAAAATNTPHATTH